MRIIVDSIKDHLIPQVSSKKTPKQMYDALSRMYEGRNINKKMNLRAQLKGAPRLRKENRFKITSQGYTNSGNN